MNTAQSVSPKERRKLSRQRVAMISITISLAIILISSLIFWFSNPSQRIFSLNALIVDQLSQEHPNEEFVNNVTYALKAYGFNVTYYNDNLNVDFFKKLTEYQPGILILRVHSALRNETSGSTQKIDLFTSERYLDGQHSNELERGLLSIGEYAARPEEQYLAITAEFIRNLKGNFPRTVVIAMGCWSLKPEAENLAKAFIDKGAEAYFGWTETVRSEDTDKETANLLNSLMRNETLEQAVSGTANYTYTDPEQGTTATTGMRFYPEEESSLTISSLVLDSKGEQLSLFTGLMSLASAATSIFEWAYKPRLKF